MSTGTYDISAEQGATLQLTLTWRDSSGGPIDLTGYTASMRVAGTKGAALVLNPTTVNTQIVLGGVAGTIAITVPAAATGAVAGGLYVYDLDLTSATGVVTRILNGKFNLDQKV